MQALDEAKRKGVGKEDAQDIDSDDVDVLPQGRADFVDEESEDEEIFV